MSMLARLATTGGATQAYVDDVFSTYLYTGNGSTQTINNGIDLAGKGGLVWTKNRTGSSATHILRDSERGTRDLKTQNTDAQTGVGGTDITAFNANGFSLSYNTGNSNFNNDTYVSWTFRRAPKFFDVVTYTGNGANRTIAHNLGSVPGCIIVKRTDTTADWQVYHRSIANTEYLVLNNTAAKATGTTRWNSTTPTATEFSLGTDTTVNASGGTYVAYLFAHDAGGFGLSGTDNVISCGSWSGGFVNLGWEPQWILVKQVANVGNWRIIDNMRGLGADTSVSVGRLWANISNAESTSTGDFSISSTGFNDNGNISVNNIYIAIRRPNKPPTSGTSVFTPVQASAGTQTTGFPIDTQIYAWTTRSTDDNYVIDRLRGVSTSTSSDIGPQLKTNKLDSESNSTNYAKNWTNQSFDVPLNYVTLPTVYWNFRRAPGFFDVVCWTTDGTSNQRVSHNLTVAPELIITKARGTTSIWYVYTASGGVNQYLRLNTTAASTTFSAIWGTAPTSSTFGMDTGSAFGAGVTQVAYLFASLPGISKVGSYTGNGGTVNTNGTSQTINCGFTGGARFVLIKRTDSTGDWYVFDTARGIVAASDPYLLLNSTAAEVTTVDAVDTNNSGFIVNQTSGTNLNVTNATYIYLAIA